MKTIYKTIVKYLGMAAIGALLTTSCVSYLDKSPAVNITADDVFGSFEKYQGFIEDLYQEIVDPTLGTGAECNWNYGLDELVCTDQRMLSAYFEKGNYWQWTQGNYSTFMGTNSAPTNSAGKKGYWLGGWYGIRKANLAIANIGKLVNATDEERNLILGQAYFFRGYFHFEILRHWGHIPYIDSIYGASNVIQPTPITYKQCAARIDQDLRKAADLLPADWDKTVRGGVTLGNNAIRLTKGAAWAYVGLNSLYLASPLMSQDETSPNNPDSTKYDVEQCKTAAAAYAQVIKLANAPLGSGDGSYQMETFDLNAIKSTNPATRQNDHYFHNFYSLTSTMKPGVGREVIFTYPTTMYKRWNYGDFFIQQMGAWGTYSGPTANYVENFGMANGLPINAAGSGYDPQNPWNNRDPRFYYNILKDGDRLVVNPSANNLDTYVQFYIGGRHRNSSNSLTGYGYKKYYDITCNQYDNGWGNNFFYDCPKVRLAGILLEFAETANEAYGPTGIVPTTSGVVQTAADAVNYVRARAGVPAVDPRFLNTSDFRQIIRQERAVELAFEGHRWDDARRWGVASTTKYREKYELQFDAAHSYFKKVLYLTSVFEPKHWWLPFPTGQVALYPTFKQNPGW